LLDANLKKRRQHIRRIDEIYKIYSKTRSGLWALFLWGPCSVEHAQHA